MLSQQTVKVDKEFAHDCGQGKLFRFTSFEQPLVEGARVDSATLGIEQAPK